MRIAILHIRLLLRGGLETRLFSYMNFLQAAGHEVTVIVYKVGEGVTVPAGIRLIHIPLKATPKPFRAFVFDRKLGRLLAKERFDYVISLGRTSHQDAVLLPGNHLGYLRAIGKKWKGLDDRMQIYMDAKAYAAPGFIYACSQMMKDEVVELYGVNPDKIRVLYPPSDTKRFHGGLKENQQDLRKKFGMRDGYTSCVLVSASHSRKGLPFLMEVFRLLKDEPVELLVAGGEPVGGDLPNVRGLGFVRNTEELFAAADCTLLPALYEPYGQVVTESILCHTPVLVSGQVGAKAVVEAGLGSVLEEMDASKWADAIRRMRDFKFELPEDWVGRHKFDLKAHMQALLNGRI